MGAVLRFIVLAAVFMAALIGLFVAWWIVVLALLALTAYVALRRLIGGRRRSDDEAVVIQGEYRIEREPEADEPGAKPPAENR